MKQAQTLMAPRRNGRAARGVAAAAAALAGGTLLIAGCGASSPPGVASIGGSGSTGSQPATSSGVGGALGAPSTSSGGGGPAGGSHGFAIAGNNRQDALKFAACMRANGMPNFPDPNSQGVIQGSGIDPGSAAFQSAQQKCAKYSPNGGRAPSPAQQAAAEAQALQFSACMRSHGVTNFPDPQFSSGAGGFGVRIHVQAGAGLDPGSPIFQAAQKACGSFLPGLKRAAVPPASGGGGA